SNEDPTSEDITAEAQSTIIDGNEPTFYSEIAEASATKSLSNSISDKRITVNVPDRDDLTPDKPNIKFIACLQITVESKHNPRITTDPTKHRNVHSQKTECP
ncbi:8_t:CDS:2, partial [Entrophospora sp. SA101]